MNSVAVAAGGDFLNFKKFWQIPTEPKLIGLTGRARSGKDTVGSMLSKMYEAKAVAFADHIRNMLRAIGLSDIHFNDPTLKEVEMSPFGKSPRQMMQTLGTEWGRNLINEKIWLILAAERINEIHDDGNHAVVTDVRFNNEAEMIRNMGGVIWHIHRPGQLIASSTHKSEAGVEFTFGDIRIDNNGTLDDLLEQVIDSF